MGIRIKLFAAVRDAFGADEVAVEATTVAEVAGRLRSLQPSATLLIDRSRFAVNQSFASMDTPLHESDEVAIIPPVSGG